MTYQQTLKWMFSQLPMYQRQGNSAFKKDLDNILIFSKHLNHPEKQFKTIHVAGTNGKGSVSHMIASVLQQAGFKVGLYTSPHLKDFRERIKINGKMIDENDVVDFIQRHQSFLEENQLSFFEMTVGMAFQYFAEQEVDIAIIETGLGGRLDSTNIIQPLLSVITNISLDHTAMLGENLSEIAFEKAGIIKPQTPVVIGEKNDSTSAVFINKAKKEKAPIYFAEEEHHPAYQSDLKGIYQTRNIQTVASAIEKLRNLGWKIKEEDISTGLLNVFNLTGFQGRWQQLGEHPKIICDTGHNPAGLNFVFQQLEKEVYQNLHFVLGVVDDKDLDSILPMFPKDAQYYFCRADVPRALDEKELSKKAAAFNLKGKTYKSVNQAFTAAKANAKKEDLIFVGGSTFTVAEIL